MDNNNPDYRSGYHGTGPGHGADMAAYHRGRMAADADRQARERLESDGSAAGGGMMLLGLVGGGAVIWLYTFYFWAALASVPLMVLLVRYALAATGSRLAWGPATGTVVVGYLVALAAVVVVGIVALISENVDGPQIGPAAMAVAGLAGGTWKLERALGPLRIGGVIGRYALLGVSLAVAYAGGLAIAQLVRTA